MKSHPSFKAATAAIVLALSGVACVTPAVARQSASGASFQDLDKNHDGKLARSELPPDMPLLRARLSTYDANQDGKLDASEFAAAKAALRGGGQATTGQNQAPQQPQQPPAQPQPQSQPPGG